MFALLRNIGISSIIKIITFIGLAVFAWWSDKKADNVLVEKEQLESYVAVLQSTNSNNNDTIVALQKSIKEREALMMKRNAHANAITHNTVEEKAVLTQTIKDSTDESTQKWADQPVPDVVIRLLKLKPP